MKTRQELIRKTVTELFDAGMPLDKILTELPENFHAEARQVWKKVSKRKRNTLSFAVTWIAQMDESANLDDDPESSDYIGLQSSVILVAEMFNKPVDEIVRLIMKERRS